MSTIFGVSSRQYTHPIPIRKSNDKSHFRPRDICVFGALGRLDENEFGTDCAGVVVRVGSQCTELCPGDQVCTSSFGCMRTYVQCSESDAAKISDFLSMEEACGVINPGMTAWYSLVDMARLKKGGTRSSSTQRRGRRDRWLFRLLKWSAPRSSQLWDAITKSSCL